MRTMTVLVVGCLSAFAQSSVFTVVSAASGSTILAKESIGSVYGRNLAFRTESAPSVPLSTTLGGVTLQVVDNQGVSRFAPLYYVSSAQINFEVPAGTVSGVAKVNVLNGTGATISGTAQIQNVAPALFTAGGSGTGPVAGYGVRTDAPNSQQAVFSIYQCDANGCRTLPIGPGLDGPFYLALFGTGIRNRSSLNNVVATVNGTKAQVLYAGAQSEFAGLDQLNIAFPSGAPGTGETDLLLAVDGVAANVVRINLH